MFLAALQTVIEAAAAVPHEALETATTTGQVGLWTGLLYVTHKVVGPLRDLAKDGQSFIETLTKHIESQAEHRKAEQRHWDNVERMLGGPPAHLKAVPEAQERGL